MKEGEVKKQDLVWFYPLVHISSCSLFLRWRWQVSNNLFQFQDLKFNRCCEKPATFLELLQAIVVKTISMTKWTYSGLKVDLHILKQSSNRNHYAGYNFNKFPCTCILKCKICYVKEKEKHIFIKRKIHRCIYFVAK